MPPDNNQLPNPAPPAPPPPTPEQYQAAPAPAHIVQDLEEVEPDETLIAIIRHHFFGIFIAYVFTALALALGIGLIYFLLPSFVDRSREDIYSIVGLIAACVVVFMVVIMVVATIIYYSSRLILTNKNITQVLQVGLFNKRTSQLHVANIEDVTAIKKGVFATLLNYGVLNIETAGEAANFSFNYCPRPDFYARQILEARERVVENRRRDR